MIDYATVGTDDMDKSRAFYDAILAPLGGKVIIESPKMIFWSRPGSTMLAVCLPYDGGTCSAGNGTMLGLSAASEAVVDEVHAIALAKGAIDEGAPGLRLPNMYIAYFRDPYQNKLAVYYVPSIDMFAESARETVRAMLLDAAGPVGQAEAKPGHSPLADIVH